MHNRSMSRLGAAVFCAIALLTVPQRLDAQAFGGVEGEIRTREGGPLAGIMVSVEGSSLSTHSDSTGSFVLTGLLPGQVTLVVSGSGVQPHRQPVQVRPAETVHLRLTLDLELFVLEGITAAVSRRVGLELDEPAITGSRLDVAVRDVPASVSVVSRQAMRDLGRRTPEEAVESVPGVLAGSGVATIPTFATRGFSGNDISTLKDGVRQNTTSQSSRPLDVFNLDRIEVLKGPASVLHGEGAIAGAINYVSKAPTAFRSNEALFSYGSFNTFRLGLGTGGPVGASAGPLRYRLDASHARSDGAVEDSGYRRTNLSASLDFRESEDVSAVLFVDFARDVAGSYYGTPLIDGRIDPRTRRLNYNVEDNHSRSDNFRARLRSAWRGWSSVELRNETYVGTHDLDWRNAEVNRYNPDTGLVDRSFFLQMLRDDVLIGNRLEARVHAPLAGRESRLLVGVEASRNNMDRHSISDLPLDPVDPLAPERGIGPSVGEVPLSRTVVVDTYALLAEHFYRVAPRLRLMLGGRVEYFHLDYDNASTGVRSQASFSPFTWRAGTVYEPRSGMDLYASYSVAVEPVVQLVSLSEAAQDFGLQRGRQAEVGLKQLLWDGHGDLVPDVGEVAGQVDDRAAQDLVVGEGDQPAGRLLGGDEPLAPGPADLPDGGGQDVDPVDVAEDLADGDPVADPVVAAERVEQPTGEALDRRLQRPGEREPGEPERPDERADVADQHRDGDPQRQQPDDDTGQRDEGVGPLPPAQHPPQDRAGDADDQPGEQKDDQRDEVARQIAEEGDPELLQRLDDLLGRGERFDVGGGGLRRVLDRLDDLRGRDLLHLRRRGRVRRSRLCAVALVRREEHQQERGHRDGEDRRVQSRVVRSALNVTITRAPERERAS
jgi:iron complex outermembrane recepter protein